MAEKLSGDAPNEVQGTQTYKTLSEMPTDVLAHRIVGSLILAKGNLNGYKAIIQSALDKLAEERAALAAAPPSRDARAVAEKCAEIADSGGAPPRVSRAIRAYAAKIGEQPVKSEATAVELLRRVAEYEDDDTTGPWPAVHKYLASVQNDTAVIDEIGLLRGEPMATLQAAINMADGTLQKMLLHVYELVGPKGKLPIAYYPKCPVCDAPQSETQQNATNGGSAKDEALARCVDIFNDFDRTEIKKLPVSVQRAWMAGELAAPSCSVNEEKDNGL